MKITKLHIKNLYGISEFNSDGSSIELNGKNGSGKTSVIDAIRFALTNRSGRKYIVRNGENEGEILIETDNGLRINRKARTNQTDYKSVKKDGHEIGSPEAFLKDLFSPLQLSPVEFMQMPEREQNRILLDMIDYNWSISTIRDWFGEVPAWVDYDQNILGILADIQSEKGEYFQRRQDINRDIRNKKAFIDEIEASLPPDYNASEWEFKNVGDMYRKIEQIRKKNEEIDAAQRMIDGQAGRTRKLEAEKEISLASLDQEFGRKETALRETIAKLEEQIFYAKKELSGLAGRKQDRVEAVTKDYEAKVARDTAGMLEAQQAAQQDKEDVAPLVRQAAYVEKMKSFVNEYRRMKSLEQDVEELTDESNSLTAKIEKARSLPGEILEASNIPVRGLTVKDGIPLINGLPISNLSEGEKLDLCIDVAIQKPNGIQMILIDGVEKLSTTMREELYRKCKEKGLQFVATRTTDDEELTVVTL